MTSVNLIFRKINDR